MSGNARHDAFGLDDLIANGHEPAMLTCINCGGRAQPGYVLADGGEVFCRPCAVRERLICDACDSELCEGLDGKMRCPNAPEPS